MKQLYGLGFVTVYGEVPSAIWVAEIAKLTDAECREGLSRLACERREYPANLTEFVDACRPKKHTRYLGVPTTPEAHRKLLGGPRPSEDRRQQHLASIRAKLGRSQRERVPGEDDEPMLERTTAPRKPPVAGCTCKSSGTCDVCVAYLRIMDGDYFAVLPRETESLA